MEKIPFDPVIIEWFQQTFKEASPPQILGWPKIASGKNTLIFAPTGSGKTLAAFLWCINDLFCALKTGNRASNQSVHTLYISPLKALNNDIERNLRLPVKGIWDLSVRQGLDITPLNVLVRTGDTPAHTRQKMVKHPPHILITTPESLYLLLTSPKGREIFNGLQYVIVDEIHALSNNKRGVHLSLSLERLENIITESPVRIGLSATQKPLSRIAAFLGGQSYSKIKKKFYQRSVEIVDCGQKKDADIKILSPVDTFSDLPDATVWPAVIEKCYKLVTSHKTTLIFANMRAQTEKLVRQLNDLHKEKTGDSDSILALAHHGSMSREARFSVEDKLKNGQIPAVVATASLELGIDIGSIDLVIQLESPRSIAGSVQRIGRSGHLISKKSKGRIIPLYPADLDDAAALTGGMIRGEIEETHIPQNCLDVLAQQIIAEVSIKTQSVQDLFRMCRRSYCYRDLSIAAFENVLHMLEGRFSGTKLPALQPVIIWDKVNQKVSARRSARLTAIMNGGTIPDRGYYAVILNEQNTRLGEVEEEFVFESRVGDVFFLGNTEWRINNITNDRIMVTPAKSVKPRAPFWKGEIQYRSYESSEKIGYFRHELESRLDSSSTIKWLEETCQTDSRTAANLLSFFRKQISLTGCLPTHKKFIAEWFYDSGDELNFILHATLGARVTGLWAIAATAALETHFRSEVQYTFNDDGFLLRLKGTVDEPPIEYILNRTPREIEDLILSSLANAPIFSIQFRYNATRALLLPRSRQGKRIPLWLQRLRSSDLLQAVRQFPEFPILLETYRSCLYDVFDFDALKQIITKIQNKEISVHHIQTPYPSPMAGGLIFNFLSYQMYDYDRTRAPAEMANVSSDLLSQIITREEIPALITQETIGEAIQRWQSGLPGMQARDADETFLLIEKLGPVSKETLSARSKKPDEFLKKLKQQKRIKYLDAIYTGWITTEQSGWFADPENPKNTIKIIQHYLESTGPTKAEDIAVQLKLPYDLVIISLKELKTKKVVLSGKIVKDDDSIFWCNKNNFAELYRRAIAIRRKNAIAIDRFQFYKFQFNWHIHKKDIHKFISQYQFMRFERHFLERDLIRTRFSDQPDQTYNEFSRLISDGDIIIRNAANSAHLVYHNRGDGQIFSSRQMDTDLSKTEISIIQFLKENGASPATDLEVGIEIPRNELNKNLKSLVKRDLITTDNFDSFISALEISEKNMGARRSRPARHQIQDRLQHRSRIGKGRWFLTNAFSVQGKNRTGEEKTELQARILLQRYGILVKEWYRFEEGFLPWFNLFQVLKRMEWQGEIRRGYFLDGLSGVQFATHEAVELLENLPGDSNQFVTLSTIDPALPFGGNVSWQLYSKNKEPIKVVRSQNNHITYSNSKPILYAENYGLRIRILADYGNELIESVVYELKSWLKLPENIRPRRKIEIEFIDGKTATDSNLSQNFLKYGFEKDHKKLVLWPSRV